MTEPTPDPLWIHVNDLAPWESNPRDNEPAVSDVKQSILDFGFVTPIVLWRAASRMVAGHTRRLAMLELILEDPEFTARGAPGPGMVKVSFHDFVDEEEADLFAVRDNRSAERAKWNWQKLQTLSKRLPTEKLHLMGMDTHELTALQSERFDPGKLPKGKAARDHKRGETTGRNIRLVGDDLKLFEEALGKLALEDGGSLTGGQAVARLASSFLGKRAVQEEVADA